MKKASIFIVALTAVVNSSPGESLANEAAQNSAKADAILERMSRKLQSTPSMTFTTSETWERTKPDNEEIQFSVNRKIAVRRPDRMWFRATGGRDLELFYAGNDVTLLSHGQKVFGKFPGAPTLDATADVISSRYDIPVPIIDLLTEAPALALRDQSTSGSWEKREPIDGTECDKLTYDHRNVRFSIWIAATGEPLPRKLVVVHKLRRSEPVTTVTFRDWNLSADLPDNMFTARIPPGYEPIPVIQRASAVLSKEQIQQGPDAAGAPRPNKGGTTK